MPYNCIGIRKRLRSTIESVKEGVREEEQEYKINMLHESDPLSAVRFFTK